MKVVFLSAHSRPLLERRMPQCSFTEADIGARVQHFDSLKVRCTDKAAFHSTCVNVRFGEPYNKRSFLEGKGDTVSIAKGAVL